MGMSNHLFVAGIGLVVFLLAAASDIVEARYVQAVQRRQEADVEEKARLEAHRAAVCSVLMWAIGVTGLWGVLEVGWWILPFDAVGLYAGSRWALRWQEK